MMMIIIIIIGTILILANNNSSSLQQSALSWSIMLCFTQQTYQLSFLASTIIASLTANSLRSSQFRAKSNTSVSVRAYEAFDRQEQPSATWSRGLLASLPLASWNEAVFSLHWHCACTVRDCIVEMKSGSTTTATGHYHLKLRWLTTINNDKLTTT